MHLEQATEGITAPMLQPMCDNCSQLSEVTLSRVEGDAVTLMSKQLQGLRKLTVRSIVSAPEEDLSAFSCSLEELSIIRAIKIPVRQGTHSSRRSTYSPCFARLPLACLRKPLQTALELGLRYHSATGEQAEQWQQQMAALHADAGALVQHYLSLGAKVPRPPLSTYLDLRKPREASDLLQALSPFAAAPSLNLASVRPETDEQVQLLAASELGKAAACIAVDVKALGGLARHLFPKLAALHVCIKGSLG